jgi:hypothetical protein
VLDRRLDLPAHLVRLAARHAGAAVQHVGQLGLVVGARVRDRADRRPRDRAPQPHRAEGAELGRLGVHVESRQPGVPAAAVEPLVDVQVDFVQVDAQRHDVPPCSVVSSPRISSDDRAARIGDGPGRAAGGYRSAARNAAAGALVARPPPAAR